MTDQARADAERLVREGDGEAAIRLIGEALGHRFDKALFARQAALVEAAGDPVRTEAFLVQEICARPANMHAARLLIGLESDKAGPTDLAAPAVPATGPAAAILNARAASVRLSRDGADAARPQAEQAVELAEGSARRIIAQALAARFDWHGALDVAEMLLKKAHGSEDFALLSDRLKLRHGGHLDDETARLFAAADTAANPDRLAMMRLRFDWCWRRDGPADDLVAAGEGWERSSEGRVDARLRGDRIAMLLELGRADDAATLMTDCPEVESLAESVLPVAVLRHDRGDDDAATVRSAALYAALEEGSVALDTMLARQSIAVVGNAASARSVGRGADIDGRDLVMRFNRAAIGGAHAADYGSRTDVHVLPVRSDETKFPPAPDAQVVAFAAPHARFRIRNWAGVHRHRAAGRTVADLAGRGYADLAHALGAPPSAGLRFLHHIAAIRNGLSADEVFGFGFTDQLGAGTSSHYFEASRPSMHHHWTREGELFRGLITRPS